MTVKELIDELAKLPPDSQVVIQSDGNDYSPLDCVDGDAIYTPDSSWSGEILSTKWTAAEADYESESEWEAFKSSQPRCCVLSPVN